MAIRTTRLRGRAAARRPQAPAADATPAPTSEPTATPGAPSDGDATSTHRDLPEALKPLLSSLAESRQPLNQSLVEAMARIVRASHEPARAAFLARALNALARLAPQLDLSIVGDAAGKLSDYAVLYRALQEPEALGALREEDPLAEARLRGFEVEDQIMRSEGGTMTVQEVARHLGVSRQAVDKRRRAERLLALPIGEHRYIYPAWQFDENGILPGFEEVMAAFSLPGPWTRAAFFLGENTCLDGKRPLDELRRGNVDAVRRAAWAHGQHGLT